MSVGFAAKRAMLAFWRGSGLSQIGFLRRMRKVLIPNTRAWHAADLSLKSAAAPAASPENKSELAKIQFWQSDMVRFPEVKISHRYWENALLVVNTSSPTEQEKELARKIQADGEFLTFRDRHLWTLAVDDTPSALAPNLRTFDLSRVVERFVSQSKATLQSIGYVIVINPTVALGAALRQCTYTAKLVCIFTPDFTGTPSPSCLEYADRVVCPMSLSLKPPQPLNGITEYSTPEQAFDSLTASIRDLLRKEFNMLLPAWRCMERIERIDSLNQSHNDLVLFLKCSDADTPVVHDTFGVFVGEVAAETDGILASEELCQKYANLIADLDNEETRKLFLLRAIQDGARCEFVYA